MDGSHGSRTLLLGAVVLASSLPAGSAEARLRSLIAFDRALDGSGRIHVVGQTGDRDRVITPAPGFEAPTWSPDGTAIAFESGAGAGDSDLYAYATQTGEIRRLTRHPGLDAYPSWSPDGSRIAWTALRAGRFAVWVMNRDGQGTRRLTSGRADVHPAWSPDGRSIAFFDAASRSLELVRADGTRRRRIGGARAFDVSAAPAWSPDGRRIAVSGTDGAVYVVASGGHAAPRRLTPGRPGTITWRPAWSPRGGQIAFIDLTDGALDVAYPDAGAPRMRILARHTDALSTPAWSPDGSHIAFADARGHLETVTSDGRMRRVLTHGISADANPAWRPA